MAGDSINALQELLRDAGVVARAEPSRIVTPSFFDGVYNFAIIASVLQTFGSSKADGALETNVSVLRFVQFVAVRPSLLGDFQRWCENRSGEEQLDLCEWPLIPRGYVTDSTALGALTFLAAIGEIEYVGKNITLPSSTPRDLLRSLLRVVQENDLFAAERNVIGTLKNMRVTQRALGVS